MEFAGIHNDKMAGFYRSGYKDAQGNKKYVIFRSLLLLMCTWAHFKYRYMVVTQFEATDCRRCFPSFDEPNLKSTFDITLNVSHDRTALSNMNVVSESQVTVNGKTLKSLTFARTPIMSTYVRFA
jgi:aminopeptidase 2